MSDPHVVALRYRFASLNEFDRFGAARPLSTLVAGFAAELDGGILVAKPRAHYATIDEARAALEPSLADWVASARLAEIWHEIRFEFEDAEVIDRIPDGVVVRPPTIRATTVMAQAVIVRDNPEYPPPPAAFHADPVVDSIIGRLRGLDSGRTTITDAANWTLTLIESEYGGSAKGSDRRKRAARTLALDPGILSAMGRLASQNDPIVGRKAKGPVQPLTLPERAWLRAAVVLIARQIAERNATGSASPKTLRDLPLVP